MVGRTLSLIRKEWLIFIVVSMLLRAAVGDTLTVGADHVQSISVGDQHQHTIVLDGSPVRLQLKQSYLNLRLTVSSVDGDEVVQMSNAITNVGNRSFVFDPPIAGNFVVDIVALPGSVASGDYSLQFSRINLNR